LENSVSLVQIQLLLLKTNFWVKFCQNFDMKKMEKQKKTPIWRVVQGNFMFLYSIWEFIIVVKSGGHPENRLAKFGYILFESRRKTESFYNLGLHTGTYHKNLTIMILISLKSGLIGILFLMKFLWMRSKSYFSESYFSGQNLVKIHG
jgi:hypothetical protein